ncbi:TetR/AcrR family transcriptional regulator [Microtetraspora fusca]|uniref:TetR/AcrR family transcriptional regulator n=1 Tax=Microtetraspora fusca TaxID=1997 RepID=A0ABW6UYD5_MICFU|nr:TetR/AcrR family transcriptional regulator [Microtetraspora fusca]
MVTTGERVERAALELFAEKGFAATGIREIAERAGVSSGALYHYMGTKEDLLAQVMNRGNARLLHLAEAALAGAAGPAERLARLVAVHVYVHAHAQLDALVIDSELRSLGEEARSRVMELRDRYELLWRNALSEGRAAGAFRFNELGIARLALLEMCTGVARWYSPRGPVDDRTLGETFVDMAFGLINACGPDDRRLTHADVAIPDLNGLAADIAEELAKVGETTGGWSET